MQALVDAVREAGETQVVAASGFRDGLGFREFGPEAYINDSNVICEIHPYFDLFPTNAERNAGFGQLAGRVPVYAGEWGLRLPDDLPACRAVPTDPGRVSDLLIQTPSFFDNAVISWTAYAFQPGELIRNFEDYAPTRPWTCGRSSNPEPGMGEFVLVWLTGDLEWFGALSPSLIATAAGGPAGPVAPGEIISIYGFRIGPDPDVHATMPAASFSPRSATSRYGSTECPRLFFTRAPTKSTPRSRTASPGAG